MRNTQAGIASLIILIGVILVVGAIGTATYLTLRTNTDTNAPEAISNTTNNSSKRTPISVNALDTDQIDLVTLDRSPSLKSKNQREDGTIQYLLTSYLTERDNQVLVKDQNIVFKRVVFFTISNQLPKFTDYTEKYGQPEEIVSGSKYYGQHIENYLYPQQGLVVVGNADTNEVFEAQTFRSISLVDYKSQWGQDLGTNSLNNDLSR